MFDIAKQIAENVARVRERIAAAAARSGRRPEDVTLVAVSKYVGTDEVRALLAAGCHDLGESRPQELWRKAETLGEAAIRWHLIGHLQRNKIARTLPLVSLLHSGDSLRLLEAVHAECLHMDRKVPALLEINVSGDATKHGFHHDEVEPLGDALARLDGLQFRGLMCMAGREGAAEDARREFAQLRELRDRLQTAWAGRFELAELSMGMSGDFEIAVEEGATLVRVGSMLFEGAGD
ncbi:MAG TPA: YggS family pyridoxal phosphate-dependent enzyme [Pirellulales bacterium]|nr:YggS family pyridoxal phosphate-dependent enzyme [Pirellulales bacterium]